MKVYIFFFITIVSLNCFGQHQSNKNFLYGGSIGYTNQSGNFGKVGAFGMYGFGNNNLSIIKVDINANITGMQNKVTVIPEIGTTYYFIPSRLAVAGFFVETELTPYTFTPKAGISLLSIIDLGIGYGSEIQQKKDFKSIKGLQFSLGINIPFNFNIY
jgi:hypothetical protein